MDGLYSRLRGYYVNFQRPKTFWDINLDIAGRVFAEVARVEKKVIVTINSQQAGTTTFSATTTTPNITTDTTISY